MAQINQWGGGLSTRIDPALISTAEGVTYTNIDNSQVILAPLKADTLIASGVQPYCYKFKGSLLQSNNYRSYVEFQENIYYSDNIDRPKKSTDGITWYNLGIVKPSNILTISASGTSTMVGTYQYCYTYFNDNDGTESQPSEFSTELTVASTGVLVNGIIASSDPQVTHIRLYRIGGSLTEMSLVTTLDNITISYTDTLGDDTIDGAVLISYSYAPAPTGLKYLTEWNVMFFGVLNDKLYFSDIAFVNYWSELSYIDFDAEITGIGATSAGLLVFTAFKVYIVVGNDPATLTKYFLNGSQGCIEHRTIKFANNTVLWLSQDGVCASNGGAIQVLTRDKLGRLSYNQINTTLVYDDIYYIALDNRILCMDSRYTTCFREISIVATSMFVYEDTIYYVSNSNLYTLETSSSYKTMTYISGKLTDFNSQNGVGISLSTYKNYKDIYVYSTGTLTITFYIDGIEVLSQVLNEGYTNLKLPQDKRTGYYLSYKVVGTGKLMEIEYKLEGRQNGR